MCICVCTRTLDVIYIKKVCVNLFNSILVVYVAFSYVGPLLKINAY